MPELKNARHELFAQGLALGKSQTQAYIDAGFSETGAKENASRLITKDNVAHRANELKAAAAKGTVLTIERLTTDLLRLAQKGEDLAEAPGLSVARAAIMDAAKLNGLVVDLSKSDNKHTISEEMQAWLDQRQ